jgi:hypothetical protein
MLHRDAGIGDRTRRPRRHEISGVGVLSNPVRSEAWKATR